MEDRKMSERELELRADIKRHARSIVILLQDPHTTNATMDSVEHDHNAMAPLIEELAEMGDDKEGW